MKRGFGLIGILIVIAVIALAGGGGLYWNEAKKQQSFLQTGTDAQNRAEELKKQIESRQESIYGGRTSINIEQIRNASFESTFFKKMITLREGLYSEKSITDSAVVATAQIYGDKIAFGDVDGDGISDALAVVTEYGGGSGSFRSLIAFENHGGAPLYIARADLGDRTVINSIKIESGIVVLDMVVQGSNDGMCCPTLHVRKSYQLVGDRLKGVIVGDTSNWKTYRNEKYGFEVKYPENWKFEIIPDYNEKGEIVSDAQVFFFTSDDLHRVIIAPHGSNVPRQNDLLYGWKEIFSSPKDARFTISILPINARQVIDQEKIPLLKTIVSTFKFIN